MTETNGIIKFAFLNIKCRLNNIGVEGDNGRENKIEARIHLMVGKKNMGVLPLKIMTYH